MFPCTFHIKFRFRIVGSPYPKDHDSNRLKSAIHKDVCKWIWIAMAQLILGFLKIVSTSTLNWSPGVTPPYTLVPQFEQISIYTIWGCLHIAKSNKDLVVLRRVLSIHIKLWSLIVANPTSRDNGFNKFESILCQKAFVYISFFLAQLFLRILFK